MSDFVVPITVSTSVDQKGHAVLLNTATGKWHALNGTATSIFAALQSGDSLNAIVTALVAAHPATPEGLLVKDTQDIVAELVKRGLLVPDTTAVRHAAAIDMALPTTSDGPCDVVACMAVIITFPFVLLLLALPFRLTVAVVSVLKRRWARSSAGRDQVMATLAALHAVARRYPGRFACLERSLACVLALAIRRRSVQWCLGASTDPYSFHAWIELDGVPVLHPLDKPINVYRVMLRV
ncbi:lasso peptide biosynthesis B2 protein [Kibdelosporangium lantanae]|uniref:Lasso peptide biosynthesis B2 protein n=1 Tax=Kibdelosporangium lantanae TaxID=1497396 RepID=A0ABW3M542_9PSEU